MFNKYKFKFTSLITLLLVVGVACTSGVEDPASPDQPEAVTQQPQIQADSESDRDFLESDQNIVEVDIQMSNFAYSPNVINAKPGDKVIVRLANVGGTHDFVIDELDVKTQVINAAERDVVEFSIPESAAGQTFEFYCSVGSHKALGMVGTLVVE